MKQSKESLLKKKKIYRDSHVEKIKLYRKTHQPHVRLTKLGTIINGKCVTIYGLSKRPYPPTCELCHIDKKRLVYHHWDNTNLNKGMWICNWCHTFIGGFEKGLTPKYLSLKQTIENEF